MHLLPLVDPVDNTYRRLMNRKLTVQESRHRLARAMPALDHFRGPVGVRRPRPGRRVMAKRLVNHEAAPCRLRRRAAQRAVIVIRLHRRGRGGPGCCA
ncbi:hypothetical protein AB0I33_33155 [Streptomyces globisporus]